MFLPIVNYTDGYGFTYGGRFSTVDLLGIGERLSVPLTWGGTRRAALEVERTFKRGPLTRVAVELRHLAAREPALRDRRPARRAERPGRTQFRRHAARRRRGDRAARSTSATLDDRLWTIGADAALDTRGDPAFPRNAVLLGAGWTACTSPRGRHRAHQPLHRRRARLPRRRSARSCSPGAPSTSTADATLPLYERLLLGGASTLRGFRAGTFDGDRTLVTSAELRVPITSVLSGAKLGVTAFVDAGKAWNCRRARTGDAAGTEASAAGVFLIASIVKHQPRRRATA